MKGLNKILIIGTLGSDPEIKSGSSGNTVANFSVAVNEQWRDKQGEKQERTEWIKCVAWGKMAEICGQYLTKGSQVYLEGKIQTRQWENKEGQKQYTTEVIVSEMIMLGGKSDKQDKPKTAKKEPSKQDDFGSDSIPF